MGVEGGVEGGEWFGSGKGFGGVGLPKILQAEAGWCPVVGGT